MRFKRKKLISSLVVVKSIVVKNHNHEIWQLLLNDKDRHQEPPSKFRSASTVGKRNISPVVASETDLYKIRGRRNKICR